MLAISYLCLLNHTEMFVALFEALRYSYLAQLFYSGNVQEETQRLQCAPLLSLMFVSPHNIAIIVKNSENTFVTVSAKTSHVRTW